MAEFANILINNLYSLFYSVRLIFNSSGGGVWGNPL